MVVVAILSAYHLARCRGSAWRRRASRGELLPHAIFQRAREVVRQGAPDPYAALRDDGGIRSILQSSIGYSART